MGHLLLSVLLLLCPSYFPHNSWGLVMIRPKFQGSVTKLAGESKSSCNNYNGINVNSDSTTVVRFIHLYDIFPTISKMLTNANLYHIRL